MFAKMCFKLIRQWIGLQIVVMIARVDLSREFFSIDVLISLRPSLERGDKHVLSFIQLHGDRVWHRQSFIENLCLLRPKNYAQIVHGC